MSTEPVDPFAAVVQASAALAEPDTRQIHRGETTDRSATPGTDRHRFPGGFIDCQRWRVTSEYNGRCEPGMSVKFYYCLEGDGRFTAPQGLQPFRAGDLIYFAPGQSHGMAMDQDAQATLLMLHMADYTFADETFGDHDVRALLDHLNEQAFNGQHLITITEETRTRVDTSFRALDRESTRSYRGRNAIIKAEVFRLAAALIADPQMVDDLDGEMPYSTSLGRLTRVLDHIRNNYRERITVRDMAQLAELSRSHFHAAFRRATGCSLIEYVNRFRLMRAKTALLRSDEPLATIAEQYGFGNASRFSTVHKQLYGITPNQARRDYRNAHLQESLRAFGASQER